MVKRRDFIKGILGAVGLGAASKLPAVELKGQPKLEPSGEVHLTVIDARRKKRVVKWCGEEWNMPEDSGITKVVKTPEDDPGAGADIITDYYDPTILTTTDGVYTSLPGYRTMKAAAYAPPGQQVIADGIIFTWSRPGEEYDSTPINGDFVNNRRWHWTRDWIHT